MSLDMEADDLPQIAILWEAVGIDDSGVMTVSATPVEINCRWSETKSEGSNSQQSPVSKVPDIIVDRDIPIGSILWLGSFLDISGTDQTPPGDFRQVTKFSKVPDLKADYFFRSASLVYFGNTLPTRV